jgi:hypothetical protein
MALACLGLPVLALGGEQEPAKIKDYQVIRQMHKESVRIRGRYGLPAQELDEDCCKIAQRWANRMAADSWMRHGGGEQIIAKGYSTPQSCFLGWMRSQGHKNWVLCQREKCGFGCAKDKSGRKFWVGVYRSKTRTVSVPDDQQVADKVEPVQNGSKNCQTGVCIQGSRRGLNIQVNRWRAVR